MVDSGYRSYYGVDWPPVPDGQGGFVPMTKEFAGLVVGKKWKFFKEEQGIEFDVEPWVAMLDSAKKLMPSVYTTVSEWTEQHFHDWCMCPKGIVTIGCAACSKAQPLDAVVYTPTGPRTMGELQVGDYVLSAAGTPARIVKTHDVGVQNEYEVRFKGGVSTLCAGDHLWTVYPRRKDPKCRTVTAGWLYEHAGRFRYSVPLCRPVQFNTRPVELDPYVLGALLGDGSLGSSTGKTVLSFTNPDPDVLLEVQRGLPDGYILRRMKSRDICYYVTDPGLRGNQSNMCIRFLKQQGLWGKASHEKFVPDDYKYNSIEVRTAVLAGLMDTDGSVNKEGVVSFVSTSVRLRNDVAELAQSLGAAVTLSEEDAGYKDKQGLRHPCRRAYKVFIHMPDPSVLFRCVRKKERTRKNQKGNSKRVIESVVKTGRHVPMKCITIENPDGLYLTNDFVVTHNSHDTGRILVLDYVVDPFDTVILLGSTTKDSLKSRSWNFVQQGHAELLQNKLGFLVPGKITKAGYALVNVSDDSSPESVGEKAGIQGRALNEDGNLQGAHGKFVRLVVDELATIKNHDAIKTAIVNLRVGALDFKFAALANPENWDDPSCQYIIPSAGKNAVNPDTGFWTSSRGYWVRHHDGLKSPALTPEGAKKFPYLMNQSVVDDNLAECDGNADAPQFWKMVRGFPMPLNVTAPTVLDPRIAEQQKCTEPFDFASVQDSSPLANAAGIDPAWTEGGDGAIYQRVALRNWNGRTILDFGGGQRKLSIKASSQLPVAQQLVTQVREIMQDPGGYPVPLSATAVDASANQGLADDLDIMIGQGASRCLHINYASRASENLIRPIGTGLTDNADKKVETCKDRYQDRGTESWCVLAEFIRAGMVRGLPLEAMKALTTRRFMLLTKKSNESEIVSGVKYPLQMEAKADFKRRFKHSPDEADACALAALAVKEVLGVMPFGWFTAAAKPLVGPATVPSVHPLPSVDIPDCSSYASAWGDDGSYSTEVDYGNFI